MIFSQGELEEKEMRGYLIKEKTGKEEVDRIFFQEKLEEKEMRGYLIKEKTGGEEVDRYFPKGNWRRRR